MGAYIEAVDDTFDYDADWLEAIGDNGPASTGLSADSQEATLTGYIPWRKQRSAARHFLGFAYSDPVAPYLLHRENPRRHPLWPQLYAANISFAPVVVEANTDNPSNRPYDASPFEFQSWAARYKYALATVTYRSFRCNFLPDNALGGTNRNEWMRNAYFDISPRVEALTVDGISQLTYAEGVGGGTGPTAGVTNFPAPIAALLAKNTFSLVWTNVPWEHLSVDPDVFYPSKILACIGRVNNAVMFNNRFPIGTILMQPPQFSIKSSYVASDSVNYPIRLVDVVLNFEYFNPDKGIPGSVYRGHRLMPWRGKSGDPTSGKFFFATRGGLVTDKPMLEETDLMTCFENVNE